MHHEVAMKRNSLYITILTAALLLFGAASARSNSQPDQAPRWANQVAAVVLLDGSGQVIWQGAPGSQPDPSALQAASQVRLLDAAGEVVFAGAVTVRSGQAYLLTDGHTLNLRVVLAPAGVNSASVNHDADHDTDHDADFDSDNGSGSTGGDYDHDTDHDTDHDSGDYNHDTDHDSDNGGSYNTDHDGDNNSANNDTDHDSDHDSDGDSDHANHN